MAARNSYFWRCSAERKSHDLWEVDFVRAERNRHDLWEVHFEKAEKDMRSMTVCLNAAKAKDPFEVKNPIFRWCEQISSRNITLSDDYCIAAQQTEKMHEACGTRFWEDGRRHLGLMCEFECFQTQEILLKSRIWYLNVIWFWPEISVHSTQHLGFGRTQVRNSCGPSNLQSLRGQRSRDDICSCKCLLNADRKQNSFEAGSPKSQYWMFRPKDSFKRLQHTLELFEQISHRLGFWTTQREKAEKNISLRLSIFNAPRTQDIQWKEDRYLSIVILNDFGQRFPTTSRHSPINCEQKALKTCREGLIILERHRTETVIRGCAPIL